MYIQISFVHIIMYMQVWYDCLCPRLTTPDYLRYPRRQTTQGTILKLAFHLWEVVLGILWRECTLPWYHLESWWRLTPLSCHALVRLWIIAALPVYSFPKVPVIYVPKFQFALGQVVMITQYDDDWYTETWRFPGHSNLVDVMWQGDEQVP